MILTKVAKISSLTLTLDVGHKGSGEHSLLVSFFGTFFYCGLEAVQGMHPDASFLCVRFVLSREITTIFTNCIHSNIIIWFKRGVKIDTTEIYTLILVYVTLTLILRALGCKKAETSVPALYTGMPNFRYFPLFLAQSVLLLHLSLSVSFCVHFCETAGTHRFSVIFAKVQWHPCL